MSVAKQRAMSDPQDLHRSVFEGDNLHVLRNMNSNSVDLMYLDPPFNSNAAYSAPIGSKAAGAAFKDTWTLSDIDLQDHNRLKREHPSLYALIHAAGQLHSTGMFSYLMMMAPRLLEMRRVLKNSGSIWMHCDDTAVHYLKLLMDGVFGKRAFKSDVSWIRQAGGKNDARKAPGRVQDRLLFYGASYFPDAVARKMEDRSSGSGVREDPKFGKYYNDNLTGPGASQGESGADWRGFNPTSFGRHWAVPKTGALAKWIEDEVISNYRHMSLFERLDALDAHNLIHWPKKKGGWPTVKRPLRARGGARLTNLWDDIPVLARSAKERVGYPTQKPLALLERIIKTSSREGDLVLDPFCGCATTMVAAEILDRKWVGIDLSPLAAQLVVQRIKEKRGLFRFKDIHCRDTVPVRTDIERRQASTPSERKQLKETLYQEQGALCNLCHGEFEHGNMEMDHIFPKARGGKDWVDNFQLLCPRCNRVKQTKTQEEARARLAEMRVIHFAPFGHQTAETRQAPNP